MNKTDSILITGGSGLLGSTLKDKLLAQGFQNISAPTSKEVDLMDFGATVRYVERLQPKYVFHSAGVVYGIMGNLSNKGRSFLRNTLINTHVIEASRLARATKILGMGSICVYPYPAPMEGPLTEEIVWNGRPHPGEEYYGHAKRSMLAQLRANQESYGMDYAFVMSTNLYGPNDRFDVANGHVIPSLVAKFFEAKKNNARVPVWGDGKSKRDFLYSEDAAEALIQIMDKHTGPINMATGHMQEIGDAVRILSDITGLADRIDWDTSKPRGHDFVGFNIDKLNSIGFVPKHSLTEGLRKTYHWYAENYDPARR